jgi:hypothetical protein
MDPEVLLADPPVGAAVLISALLPEQITAEDGVTAGEAGKLYTVNVRVVAQPVVVTRYVIVVVPRLRPPATPDVEPIEPTEGLLLLQVPPVPLVSVVVVPRQSEDAPEIAAGSALTVNVVVL